MMPAVPPSAGDHSVHARRRILMRALLLGLTTMEFASAEIGAQGTAATPARISSGSLAVPRMEIQRLSRPIAMDGVLNDSAWADIAPLPVTMYTPVFRGPQTQRTEIRVAYDDENFYAAGWFYDTEPQSIRVNSLYRDRWNGDDAFAIYIDSFNDKMNAKWFGTTPGGIRFDQLISDDGATLNGAWDAFWESKTTRTNEGWFAEVRIPLSSLGFRVGADGLVSMGLTVTRVISRSDERVTFPAIDPRFEFRRPSVAQEIALRDVKPHKPLYVTPFALTGRSQHAVRTTGVPLQYRNDGNTAREIGLDVRYPISGNLTLDATINTDFAQVEADDQQVNLDRFPLFFPERRRFFQEGSGVFDFTSSGGGLRLFNSRRIGLSQSGTPIPVAGGGRLVGRVGRWDVGLLEMQTKSALGSPAENFGVLRLRRGILNNYSTVGLMATSLLADGSERFALGTDGTFRTFGNHYLVLKGSGIFDNRDTSSASFAERSLVDAKFERRVAKGLQYSVTATRAGRNYTPALGFTPRRDFTSLNAFGNWFFFTDKSKRFRRVYPGALAFHTVRNSDHKLETGTWAFWVQWDQKNGGGGWLEPKWFHENVAAPFTIGNTVTIPKGAYNFADFQAAYSMSSGARLRTSVDARAGTYFDGRRAQIIASPTWNVSPNLELGTDYQYTQLRFPIRNQKADIQVARVRVRAALDAKKSGNAFVQYNSTTNRMDVNLRLRYAFAEGTDLWLVYNEGLNTDMGQDVSGLQPPRSLSRAVILKYTHTFGF